MTSHFTLLHQRQASNIQCLDFCRTMDLIAIVSDDGYLSVYRTISWERIYCKKVVEILDSISGSLAVRVCFSDVGVFLGVAFKNGVIVVLNIETDTIHQAVHCNGILDTQCEVSVLQWKYFLRSNHRTCVPTWNYGGLNQVLRGGMNDDLSLIEGKKPDSHWYVDMCEQLSDSLLLSLRVNNVLCGHIFGLYPLFTLDLSHHLTPFSIPLLSCFSESDSSLYNLACTNTILKDIDGAMRGAMQSTICLPLTSFPYSSYQWRAHSASLQLYLEQQLLTLRDITSSSLKKWKDATKVLLPKLQLLQSLMDTYELQMTPIQFLYSVSMCGLWHPAAATSFAQHWAEAGIERLRASVEAVSKEIVTSLQLRAVPIVNNVLLSARELLELHESSSRNTSTCEGLLLSIRKLIRASEQLSMKLEETLFEARLAGEAMLLYIQFVKDCSLEAGETPDSVPSTVKPDLSLRPKFHVLLNPTLVRADFKGSQGQPEHLTGTHLYAYLSDSVLPAELVKTRIKTAGFGSPLCRSNCETAYEKYEDLLELFETGDNLAIKESFGASSDEINKQDRKALASRSFAQQIKFTTEAFREVFSTSHSLFSTSLQSIAVVDPTAGVFAVRVDNPLHISGMSSAEVENLKINLLESVADNVDADSEGTILANCLLSSYLVTSSVDSSMASESQLLLVCKQFQVDKNKPEALHCCRVSLSHLLCSSESLQIVPSGSSMRMYIREDSGTSTVSVLLSASLCSQDNDKCGTYVIKINIDHLSFTTLPIEETIILVSTMEALPIQVPRGQDNMVIQQRQISNNANGLTSIHVCGERGVAVIIQEGGKLSILDLEADEECNDDDNESRCESEEN